MIALNINNEKTPDVLFDRLEVYNVAVESRYKKFHEYYAMRRMVEEIPPSLRRLIINIYYDSKATASYRVTVEDVSHELLSAVAETLDDICTKHLNGHNGIVFVDKKNKMLGRI